MNGVFWLRNIIIKISHTYEVFTYYGHKYHGKPNTKFIILARKIKDLNRVKQMSKGTTYSIKRIKEILNSCSFCALSYAWNQAEKKINHCQNYIKCVHELGFHWSIIHIYLTSDHLAYFNRFFCKPDIYTYLVLSIIEKYLQVYGRVYTVCKLRVPAVGNRNLLLVGGIVLRVLEIIFWCFHENLLLLENIVRHKKNCFLSA